MFFFFFCWQHPQLAWVIGAIGSARPSQGRGTGIETQMIHSFIFFVRPNFRTGVRAPAVPLSYDHTRMKAPHPIRTAKLSILGPDQYFGRGLQGNLGCCKSFFFSTMVALTHGNSGSRSTHVLRSYQGESTASHPNCEVKHPWARSVLW